MKTSTDTWIERVRAADAEAEKNWVGLAVMQQGKNNYGFFNDAGLAALWTDLNLVCDEIWREEEAQKKDKK